MQNLGSIWLINPFKLAENNASTHRTLLVSELTRLVESLFDDSGEIKATISGSRDDDRRKILSCTLSGTVNMACQSTFKPVPVEIERQVVFSPVLSEEAMANVPDEYEAVLFDTEELDLVKLVEDELILSLPIAVYALDSPKKVQFGPDVERIAKESKPNPFAVLADFKPNSENSSN